MNSLSPSFIKRQSKKEETKKSMPKKQKSKALNKNVKKDSFKNADFIRPCTRQDQKNNESMMLKIRVPIVQKSEIKA